MAGAHRRRARIPKGSAMTHFTRVLAAPLMSAAIFGATLGVAGTADAGISTDPNIAQVHDPRAHQTMSLR